MLYTSPQQNVEVHALTINMALFVVLYFDPMFLKEKKGN